MIDPRTFHSALYSSIFQISVASCPVSHRPSKSNSKSHSFLCNRPVIPLRYFYHSFLVYPLYMTHLFHSPWVYCIHIVRLIIFVLIWLFVKSNVQYKILITKQNKKKWWISQISMLSTYMHIINSFVYKRRMKSFKLYWRNFMILNLPLLSNQLRYGKTPKLESFCQDISSM